METTGRELAARVVRRLERDGTRMAVAESCTGGLLGAVITSVPGASAVFWGGVIAYSDDAKVRLLEVDADTIRSFGAVSEPTASQMAAGLRSVARTDWAVSITGIAGPEGGTPDKPVGTVCIAVDGETGSYRTFSFSGDRDEVRRRAVLQALRMLREALGDDG